MKIRGKLSFSKLLKYYYSIGAVLYSIALPAIAGALWWTAERLVPGGGGSDWTGLGASFLSAYGVAYFVPEPADAPENAGKFRLTLEEGVTGFFAAITTFVILVGAKCLAMAAVAH